VTRYTFDISKSLSAQHPASLGLENFAIAIAGLPFQCIAPVIAREKSERHAPGWKTALGVLAGEGRAGPQALSVD